MDETCILECMLVPTPIELETKVELDEDSSSIDHGQFKRLVGRFIYLSHTKLDIVFAIGTLSQFLYDPQAAHE